MMATRELSKFEQDTLLEALTQIDAAGKAQKLAEHAAAIESEKSGRIAAEAKVGELTAELARRGEAYRVAVSDLERKLAQAKEARSTADMLAAQARAEADAAGTYAGAVTVRLQEMSDKLDALAQMEVVEIAQEKIDDAPISYRINVVARDAAGDLRSLELVPMEK